MALTDTLDRLPPWAFYGGAGVAAGGGYFLWRRHQQRVAGAGASDVQSTAASSPAAAPLAYDTSGQQPSIVPYYLTAGQGQATGSSGRRRSVPSPLGASVPGGSGATGTSSPTSGGVLPEIPPILPVAPAPAPQPAPTAPSTPAPAAPTAAPGPANLPADLLAQIRANGENIIGNLIDPATGGTWWFGNKGGVFAVNGARFLGSVPSVGASFPGFTAVQAIPLGNGYRIVNSAGQTYNFNG